MARYPASIQARVTLHQFGCIARLAQDANASEAEVIRHALLVLFSSGDDDAILTRFELELVRQAEDAAAQDREDRN
jgi:hypothetical protein